MDDDITLRSPRLWAGFYDGYMTVPEGAVYRALDSLRISVAEWNTFVGDNEAGEDSRARVANEAQALAELMTAMANHAHEGGVRELVRQIAAFMSDEHAREYVDALRERLQGEKQRMILAWRDWRQARIMLAESGMLVSEIADALDVLDALIALDETRRRRASEQQPANSH